MNGEAPRAPGWYPDPWGGDGERYFDGTSWSRDPVDALPAPRPKRSHGRLAWGLGGLVAVGVVAAIAYVAFGSGADSSHATATTASSPRAGKPATGSSSAPSGATTTTTCRSWSMRRCARAEPRGSSTFGPAQRAVRNRRSAHLVGR